MFESIIKPSKRAFQKLTKSVWTPVVEWVFALPWSGQATIVLTVTTCIGFAMFHSSVGKWSALTRRMVRVVWSKERLPLSPDSRDALNRSLSNLEKTFHGQLRQNGDFVGQPWTTAQIIVALEGEEQVDPQKATAYFRSEEDQKLHCWYKWNKPNYPPHIGATAWVLLGMASLQQPARDEEIQFILRNQHSDGWWPIYPIDPADTDEKNASTYATALVVWALYEQREKAHLPDQNLSINEAIDRGLTWLWAGPSRIPDKARWYDYPNGREMVSVSGIVLHVLHRTKVYDCTDVDRLWLESLPGVIPPVHDFETSDRTVFNGPSGPVQTDETRYYTLNCLLVGTVEAYPSGSVLDRAYALAWMERVLEPPTPLDQVTGLQDDWIAAELAISLRKLQK